MTQAGRRDARQTVVVSVPMDRCVKNFLDTRLYRELCDRFDVALVSYLSEQEGFRSLYGGPGVTFVGQPAPATRGRRRLADFVSACRYFGFLFRWHRRGAARVHWTGVTMYRIPQDYIDHATKARPRLRRHFALTILAVFASVLRPDRLLMRTFGRWIYFDRALERIFQERSPALVVATAHRTQQEEFLASYAARFGVPSVILPDSWDNFALDGFLMHEYDRFFAMGPEQARQLARYHGVAPGRVVELGVPVHRLYERMPVPAEGGFDLRARYGIPAHQRIISYISISRGSYFDTRAVVDFLCARIGEGAFGDVVLLYRTQPGEDPKPVLERYGHLPYVRVQVAGYKGGGGQGRIDFRDNSENEEYYAAYREAAVVITGFSGCYVDACNAGAPAIVNLVETEPYPAGGFSPQRLADMDPMGIFAAGCPTARSLDELAERVRQALDSPGAILEAGRRVHAMWDSRPANDAQTFMHTVEAIMGNARCDGTALQSAP